MRNAGVSGRLSIGTRHVVRVLCWATLCVACEACGGSVWTARMCASNGSGNCRGVDNGQPHQYAVKSSTVGPLHGTTDIAVHDPTCANGIGEVDVEVVDSDDLQVTFYCLNDAPTGTMTLPRTPPSARPDASAPPSSSSH